MQCIAVGTDYVQLFDRRTAEIIIHANELELAALVDVTATQNGPRVWQDYWDSHKQAFVDFDFTVSPPERLTTILRDGMTIEDVKGYLLRKLCIGAWRHLDYWGRFVEVFSATGGNPRHL